MQSVDAAQLLEESDSNLEIEPPLPIEEQGGWIKWFTSLEGHEFLSEIDEDFIRDKFNLAGIQVNFSKQKLEACLKMIISRYTPHDEDLQDEGFLELNQDASELYGLLHAKFILTARGMAKMHSKLFNNIFGHCPRAFCDKQKVLPVGLADTLRTSRVKVFCPKCEEVYIPKYKSINLDGAYFGTAFPHSFLMHYKNSIILPPEIHFYEPKLFGFNIRGKKGSKNAQQPTVKFTAQYDPRDKILLKQILPSHNDSIKKSAESAIENVPTKDQTIDFFPKTGSIKIQEKFQANASTSGKVVGGLQGGNQKIFKESTNKQGPFNGFGKVGHKRIGSMGEGNEILSNNKENGEDDEAQEINNGKNKKKNKKNKKKGKGGRFSMGAVEGENL